MICNENTSAHVCNIENAPASHLTVSNTWILVVQDQPLVMDAAGLRMLKIPCQEMWKWSVEIPLRLAVSW